MTQKPFYRFLFLASLLQTFVGQCEARAPKVADSSWSIVEKGLDHRVWQRVAVITNASGERTSQTESYTELETGMYYEENGQLQESDPVIQLNDTGALGAKTRHKVSFSPNANDWNGAVNLLTPSNERFRTRVLGLSYWDVKTGQSVLIAELKNSVGVLAPDRTQVIYADAFTDIRADLRYRNSKAGLEQDVIFLENPPSPEHYGMDPETTRLQVLTEFFESPVPTKHRLVKESIVDDRTLRFQAMQIGVGKAFMASDQRRSQAVEKEWVKLEGRDFLIEQIPYKRAQHFLQTLPDRAQVNGADPSQVRHLVSSKRLLPEREVALTQASASMEVASVVPENKGFVLDYWLTLNANLTNYVFKADTTYLITNFVSVSGSTVFEGGTVIKYHGGALLLDLATIACETDAYRPAVFTSWEDDSVGEIIPGSTGIPTSGASCALILYTASNTELKHLRISYASQAVEFNTDSLVSHCQFIKCNWGLMSLGFDLRLQNNLFYQCETALGVLQATIHGEHLTVNQTRDLVYEEFDMQLRLTNTLLVAVTNLGVTDINTTNTNFIWLTNDPGVFQKQGAGGHYLAPNSAYRDLGTTNIHPILLKGLRRKTTFSPILLANQSFTSDAILSPTVLLDDDGLPDLGYHYEPIDFIIGDAQALGVAIHLTNGVVIGFYSVTNDSAALLLKNGASIDSRGTPKKPNYLVWYNTVQEQTPSWAQTNCLDIVASDSSTATFACRFTKYSRLADGKGHIGASHQGWNGGFSLRDSEFYSGGVAFSAHSTLTSGEFRGAVTNCLFFRSKVNSKANKQDFYLNLVNNLFKGGSLLFEDVYPLNGSYSSIARNNSLDEVALTQSSGVIPSS